MSQHFQKRERRDVDGFGVIDQVDIILLVVLASCLLFLMEWEEVLLQLHRLLLRPFHQRTATSCLTSPLCFDVLVFLDGVGYCDGVIVEFCCLRLLIMRADELDRCLCGSKSHVITEKELPPLQ